MINQHPAVKVLMEAADIMDGKSQDYTDGDPFGNFKHVAYATGLTVDQVIHAHIANKVARLNNLLVRDPGVAPKNESIDDTLIDLVNYAALLVAWRATLAPLSWPPELGGPDQCSRFDRFS